jgi:WD40 repeat protein
VSSVFSVVFSADGKYFATGGSNKMVNLWSFRRCTEVVTMQDHKRWLSSVIFSPSGKHLASGSADRTVRIWCVETK